MVSPLNEARAGEYAEAIVALKKPHGRAAWHAGPASWTALFRQTLGEPNEPLATNLSRVTIDPIVSSFWIR